MYQTEIKSGSLSLTAEHCDAYVGAVGECGVKVTALKNHPPRPQIDRDARAAILSSLTPQEQVKANIFLKDGVISYVPQLSRADIQELEKLYQEVSRKEAQKLKIMGGRQEICLTLANIRKLSRDLRMKLFSTSNEAHIKHYFGSNSIHVFGVRFHKTNAGANAQEWHKDVGYVNTVVSNIVSFIPNKEAAVTTEVVRGSMSVNVSCDSIDERCKKRAKPETRATDQDAAIIFDSALIHRGNANKTNKQCVKIVIAYVNENARHVDARKIEHDFVGENKPQVALDQKWTLEALRTEVIDDVL